MALIDDKSNTYIKIIPENSWQDNNTSYVCYCIYKNKYERNKQDLYNTYKDSIIPILLDNIDKDITDSTYSYYILDFMDAIMYTNRRYKITTYMETAIDNAFTQDQDSYKQKLLQMYNHPVNLSSEIIKAYYTKLNTLEEAYNQLKNDIKSTTDC